MNEFYTLKDEKGKFYPLKAIFPADKHWEYYKEDAEKIIKKETDLVICKIKITEVKD